MISVDSFVGRRMVVAIPVHNEADYIENCLIALAAQTRTDLFHVVTLLNNCTDGTSEILRRLAKDVPFELHVLECWLDPSLRNAGTARHLAGRHAAALCGDNGIILTTDADGTVAPDWLAKNIAAIDAGADAVAGMAVIYPEDEARLPPRLVIDDLKSETFTALLDEIDWLLDPDPADPWPRHTQHSGASIAVRAEYFARAGGFPAIPLGEDRELFAQLRHIDARIRHARDVIVNVSGRAVGRAKGGMADTIARRLREPDQFLDDNLEPVENHVRRATLRARTRELWSGLPGCATAASLSEALALPVGTINSALRAETFGHAWSELERVSSVLPWRLVPVSDLEHETATARTMIDAIRTEVRRDELVRPADTVTFWSATGRAFAAAPAG